jgi:hypothetical protein
MNSGNFNFFTNNLVLTPINDGYKYNTYSEFINQMKVPIFSQTCIFCSNLKSVSLTSDDSFRRCSNCNKNFKATILNK